MKFIGSTLIFVFAQFPAILVSFIVVPFMLLSKWDGKTTWFGNFKWGRGEEHYNYPASTRWRQWVFLCIRNPVSNFGKQVLAVKEADWVWLHDQQIYKRFHWKYGWKTPSGEMPGVRTFVYRPWLKNELDT